MTCVTLECKFCKQHFVRRLGLVNVKKKRGQTLSFCSTECWKLYKSSFLVTVNCGQCNAQIIKNMNEMKNSISGKCFCSQSCSATFNNQHKTKGTRRSKFESWVENRLTEQYSQLQILYNNKEAIGSELDIFIPSLKLAIEINGVHHYKPIYGDEKLSRIQSNDKLKEESCSSNEIELRIVNISNLIRFYEKSAYPYLEEIFSIINMKLSTPTQG